MADQIERLIAAVEDVTRKITRLSTYSYTLYLGRVSTAVTAGASALLGILRFANIRVVGLIASSSSLVGSMTSKYLPYGLNPISGSSNIIGNLDLNPACAGSLSGASSSSGVLSLPFRFRGIVTGISITAHGHLSIS